MSKASFNLQKFTSKILSTESLARNNRFEVIITPPPALVTPYGELVSIYVEQASLPLLNIFTKSFKIFGPTYQRPITSEYGGEGMAFTFHVDRNMKVRRFFEDWMHTIINPFTFTVGYLKDYSTTIIIRQLDEQDNVTHEIELLEAFPRNINLMDLNNAASNQTHRLSVLFAYRYWRNTSSKNTQQVNIPEPIINPQTVRKDTRNNKKTTKTNSPKNVTPTGQYQPGTTNDDMAFGVNGLS